MLDQAGGFRRDGTAAGGGTARSRGTSPAGSGMPYRADRPSGTGLKAGALTAAAGPGLACRGVAFLLLADRVAITSSPSPGASRSWSGPP